MMALMMMTAMTLRANMLTVIDDNDYDDRDANEDDEHDDEYVCFCLFLMMIARQTVVLRASISDMKSSKRKQTNEKYRSACTLMELGNRRKQQLTCLCNVSELFRTMADERLQYGWRVAIEDALSHSYWRATAVEEFSVLCSWQCVGTAQQESR